MATDDGMILDDEELPYECTECGDTDTPLDDGICECCRNSGLDRGLQEKSGNIL